MEKIKILYGLGCYWPGHEEFSASGPIQSFDAMAAALQDRCEFKVIAEDRRPGSDIPSVRPEDAERWVQKDHVQVRYVRGGLRDWRTIARIINETDYDIIVSNGFFDQGITLPIVFLRYFGKIPGKPFILSPRGEFSPGALGLKSLRKRIYLALNKIFGFTKDVILHATSEKEAALFRASKLPCKRIDVAHVVSCYFDRPPVSDDKNSDTLNIAFVGRISAVKNLDGALQILKRVKAKVQYDIYGPLEDQEFWARCEALIKELPDNVAVSYKGPIANQDVPQTLSRYDLLFLPTHGENFGHVIHEALMSGVPCLISDQTPWRDLEAHNAGWDLPLNAPEAFAAKIDLLGQETPQARGQRKEDARAYGEKRWREQAAIEETHQMYLNACRPRQ